MRSGQAGTVAASVAAQPSAPAAAGANNNGRTRSKDGRDGTGRYPWFASVGRLWQQGHADTLADAQRAAVEAARGMYRAALAACDDESNTPR